ncbi:Transposable element Tcb1 transposase, partial [Harpegnathos saltator]
NKKARLDFAKKFEHWTEVDWRKVLFSDESKFQSFGSDGIKYIRRPTGTRYNSRYQIPTVKHGGRNVMVWGSFPYNGVGPLVEITGNMDAIMYRDILTQHILPYATRNMSRSWIFQQDNDPKYSSKLIKEFFIVKKMRVFDWS